MDYRDKGGEMTAHVVIEAIMNGTFGSEEPTSVFLNPVDWESLRERIPFAERILRLPNVPAVHFIIGGIPILPSVSTSAGTVVVLNSQKPFDVRLNFAVSNQ